MTELDRILNNTSRADLIKQVKSEYSNTSTLGKIHVDTPVEVFDPPNNLHKTAPRTVAKPTNQ